MNIYKLSNTTEQYVGLQIFLCRCTVVDRCKLAYPCEEILSELMQLASDKERAHLHQHAHAHESKLITVHYYTVVSGYFITINLIKLKVTSMYTCCCKQIRLLVA